MIVIDERMGIIEQINGMEKRTMLLKQVDQQTGHARLKKGTTPRILMHLITPQPTHPHMTIPTPYLPPIPTYAAKEPWRLLRHRRSSARGVIT